MILIPNNEAHFVSTSESPLDLNVDFLVAKRTITCENGEEKLKVSIEGQAIGKIEGVKDMADPESNAFIMNLKCTAKNNGKQEVKEFLGDKGEKISGILSLNLGLGSEHACLEVKAVMTVSANKMIQFLF